MKCLFVHVSTMQLRNLNYFCNWSFAEIIVFNRKSINNTRKLFFKPKNQMRNIFIFCKTLSVFTLQFLKLLHARTSMHDILMNNLILLLLMVKMSILKELKINCFYAYIYIFRLCKISLQDYIAKFHKISQLLQTLKKFLNVHILPNIG